jgi:hypothetical protein
MSRTRTLSGELVATGPVVYDGTQFGAAEPYSMYDYLRFEDEAGKDLYIERVVIPAYLDSSIRAGMEATFLVVEVPIPTMLGSKPMHFVYAVETGGKMRRAIEQVQKIFRLTKGAALPMFWYGLILLPAWGFGLVLWIRAVRIIKLRLPLDEMRQA